VWHCHILEHEEHDMDAAAGRSVGLAANNTLYKAAKPDQDGEANRFLCTYKRRTVITKGERRSEIASASFTPAR
jgi:hypothetical protein